MHMSAKIGVEMQNVFFSSPVNIFTLDKARQNNIVVSCNPTDPWIKPRLKKFSDHYQVNLSR